MEVLFTKGPLSLDAVAAAVRDPAHGGMVVFSGTVRDTEDGEAIASIDYQAYESMARSELERLAREVGERHGCRTAVHHRLGRVPVGEPGVLVAAAGAHRAEAFAACRELIDGLKERVPIWKASFEPAGGGGG